MALLPYAQPMYAFAGLDVDTPSLDEAAPYHPILPRRIALTLPAWLECAGPVLAQFLDVRFCEPLDIRFRLYRVLYPGYMPYAHTLTSSPTRHSWPPYGLLPDEQYFEEVRTQPAGEGLRILAIRLRRD